MDVREDVLLSARVQSSLADTLINFRGSSPLRAPSLNLSGVFYCFLSDGGQKKILDRAEQDPSLSNFTLRCTQHASREYRAWLSILQIPLTMPLNTEVFCTGFDKRRLAATHLCMLRGTVRLCFLNFGLPPSTQAIPGAAISRGKNNC